MYREMFKNSYWLSFLLLFVGVAALTVSYIYKNEIEIWVVIFFFIFGVMNLVACLISIISFLKLGMTSLSYRENFKVIEINKESIEKVKWEKGCGVSILLKDGTWMQLPTMTVNTQGLANSINAWLKSGSSIGCAERR